MKVTMVNNLGPIVPLEGDFGRVITAFSDGETSTINFVPDTLTFIDDEDEKIYNKIQRKIDKGIELTKKEADLLKVDRIIWKPPTEHILPFLDESIYEHFEARMQIIYQQMLLVFGKKFKFVYHNKADAQVGKCPENVKHALGSYECAHSSTLPALRIENPDDPNTLIAFGQGSYFHKTWNATIFLPKEVNTIDSALDKFKKYHDNKTSFREVVLGLLNSVSKGKINPKQGLQKFLETAIKVLDNVSQEKKSVEDQRIIKQYKKAATDWKKDLAKISKEALRKDLEIFAKEKKGKISEEAKKMQSAVLEQIGRNFHVSRPKNPYMITLKFLELVSADLCDDQN
jgi:hypothetical protein